MQGSPISACCLWTVTRCSWLAEGEQGCVAMHVARLGTSGQQSEADFGRLIGAMGIWGVRLAPTYFVRWAWQF